MHDAIPNTAPVKAGWIVLGLAWLLFLVPIPGLGILGWAVNLAALVIAIIVITKDEVAHGVGQLVCSIVVSPIVYFLGLILFVGVLGAVDSM
ncbi:hypothetical protein [Arenimonas sp. MALMAid1274]|uniref:hypothetical protein n=1 Tax=Arenimonas sp. MALMAid1274 TaxID=3411630 RepID=UPI003BA35CDC